MAQSLEALTRRMTSMKGIRGVVHTMKTLSVINAAPYEHAAQAVEAYHATILAGLHAFLIASRVRWTLWRRTWPRMSMSCSARTTGFAGITTRRLRSMSKRGSGPHR